jgi:hypothetical protein
VLLLLELSEGAAWVDEDELAEDVSVDDVAGAAVAAVVVVGA